MLENSVPAYLEPAEQHRTALRPQQNFAMRCATFHPPLHPQPSAKYDKTNPNPSSLPRPPTPRPPPPPAPGTFASALSNQATHKGELRRSTPQSQTYLQISGRPVCRHQPNHRQPNQARSFYSHLTLASQTRHSNPKHLVGWQMAPGPPPPPPPPRTIFSQAGHDCVAPRPFPPLRDKAMPLHARHVCMKAQLQSTKPCLLTKSRSLHK